MDERRLAESCRRLAENPPPYGTPLDSRMDLRRGIRYLGHARDQMRVRGVTDEQVIRALREYHTTYPAEPLPYQSVHARVYVAIIDGRELKVYVEEGSDPPLVRTVVRRDQR